MAPIRSQNRNNMAEQEVGRSAPPRSLQFRLCPSPDWDGFSQNRIHWAFYGREDSVTFESVFKVGRQTFNYICSLVEDEMWTRSTNYTDLHGNALSLNDRVAISLRRLSSGDSLATVGTYLGVTASTVSHVTWWFVEAMEKRSRHHLRWPQNEEDTNEIKSKFQEIQGLPNCCGAIDVTNIRFCQSLTSGDPRNEVWVDKENHASMVVQVIVGPDMKFLDLLTGLPGSMSDNRLLESSGFFQLCQLGERLNGEKIKLSNGAELREYIIGDEGFPLKPWLITPYIGRGLPAIKRNFNRKHHETWMVSQEALTKLKQTWRIIHGEMWRPDKQKLPRIIYVCCVLHNILIDNNDGGHAQQLGTSSSSAAAADHNPGYGQQHSGLAEQDAIAQRKNLARCLSENSQPAEISQVAPSSNSR